jgi:small subunit ribosomal protein S6
MRKYETIFIVNPDLSDEESLEVIEKVKGIIQNLKGEVLKMEDWGKKKLAYEIKKMSKGQFVLFHFSGSLDVLKEVERNLRLMDAVLKYQTVRLDAREEKIARMLAEAKVVEKEGESESQPEEDLQKRPRDDIEPRTVKTDQATEPKAEPEESAANEGEESP